MPGWSQRKDPLERVWLGERLRVLQGSLDFQMPEVRPAVALDNVQLVAMPLALIAWTSASRLVSVI